MEIILDDLKDFSFYNKCRNVSGWLNIDTISRVAFRKENKSKAVITTDQLGLRGIKKFRIGFFLTFFQGRVEEDTDRLI